MGDPLGWKPRVSFAELVREMAQSDLAVAQFDALCRKQGVDDFTFGGNFNRLKNLAAANGGTYYAPSVRSFDAAGVAEVVAVCPRPAAVVMAAALEAGVSRLFRVGEYKSAGEPYIRTDQSPEAREADLYWMGDLWQRYHAEVAKLPTAKTVRSSLPALTA